MKKESLPCQRQGTQNPPNEHGKMEPAPHPTLLKERWWVGYVVGVINENPT